MHSVGVALSFRALFYLDIVLSDITFYIYSVSITDLKFFSELDSFMLPL